MVLLADPQAKLSTKPVHNCGNGVHVRKVRTDPLVPCESFKLRSQPQLINFAVTDCFEHDAYVRIHRLQLS